MIEKRGLNRGSYIAGRSTHNQRIERLWRDVYRIALCSFYNLFYELESDNILDPANDVHLFTLHYVFLPRIQHLLNEFISMWNNHPLRTVGNKTPKNIWSQGMLDSANANLSAVQSIMDPPP